MPIKLTLPPQNYYTWRKLVLQRDNFTCQECKKLNSRESHHIKNYIDYPELRYEVSNGKTLCKDCHKAQHRKGWRKKCHIAI